MNKQKTRLYLSCNLLELSRCYDLHQALKQARFPFEDISVGVPRAGEQQDCIRYFKVTVREKMMNADWYIVMADQYIINNSYRPWVDIEMICAFFLDIPVIVLQPWSCWSVPDYLQRHAHLIIDWPGSDLSAHLMSLADSLPEKVKIA